MSDTNWRDNLKAGDLVICQNSILMVSRTTKTQIIVQRKNTLGGEYEERFHKKAGDSVGGSVWCDYARLEEATPQAIKRVREGQRHEKLAKALNHRNWNKVPLGKLETITTILEANSKTDVPSE